MIMKSRGVPWIDRSFTHKLSNHLGASEVNAKQNLTLQTLNNIVPPGGLILCTMQDQGVPGQTKFIHTQNIM